MLRFGSTRFGMRDTSPEFELKYNQMMMQRSGTERMLMAMEMFEAARALMRAELRKTISPDDHVAWNMALLRRTYGDDLHERTYRGVEARLRKRDSTPG